MRRVALTFILGLLAAVAGGAAGTSAAVWLGWHSASSLPSDAAAREIAGAGSSVYHRVDALFAYDPPFAASSIQGGEGYTAGHVELFVAAPDTNALRARLSSTGWTVHPANDGTFWASGDGLTISADPLTGSEAEDGTAQPARLDLTIWRAQPSTLAWLAPTGCLLGAALGVLLLLVLLRRGRAVAALTGLGLLALLPAAALTAPLAFSYCFGPLQDHGEPTAPWVSSTLPFLRIPAVLGVVLLLVALTLSLVKRRPRSYRVGRIGTRASFAWLRLR